MKELDQLVENFFQPKRDTLGLDQLVEMVEDLMGEQETDEPLVLDPAGIDFSSVASPAEGQEELLLYGIRNHSKLRDKNISLNNEFVDIIGDNKSMKKLSPEAIIGTIKVGALLGAAGLTDGTRFGSEKQKKQGGLNGTPKTDILIGDMKVSVKNADTGFQAEAVEPATFPIIFNKALENFRKKYGKKKDYLEELDGNNIVSTITNALEGYRLGKETGSTLNTFLGLKGAKEQSDLVKDKAAMEDLRVELEGEVYNRLLDDMYNLFRDKDFKEEFVRQTLTGEYKFPKGSNAVASHILYFSPNRQAFEFRPIDDDYIKEVSEKLEWQIRTGRRKGAPQAGEEVYAKEDAKKLLDKIKTVAKALQMDPKDLSDKLISKGHSLANDKLVVNQFTYEFLRKMEALAKKAKQPEGFDQFYDYALGEFKKGSNVIEKDGALFFKGRAGTFRVDGKKVKDLKGKLTEGWASDAFSKIKKVAKETIDKLKSMLQPDEVLESFTETIPPQPIPEPIPKLTNSIKK